MNPEVKAKWVEALRSGEYKQGTEALHSKDKDGEDIYCCLGVLCELAVEAGVIPAPVYEECDDDLYPRVGIYCYGTADEVEAAFLPYTVRQWAGIEGDTGPFWQFVYHRGRGYSSLAHMNDAGVEFTTIATIIEKEF